jgi:hypothetical protein
MESGISAGGAGILGAPGGGVGMFAAPGGGAGILSFGNRNKRTVAISTGLPSVLESIVPDNVFCAITDTTVTHSNNITLNRFIYTNYKQLFIPQKSCHKISAIYFLNIFWIYAFFFVPLRANCSFKEKKT